MDHDPNVKFEADAFRLAFKLVEALEMSQGLCGQVSERTCLNTNVELLQWGDLVSDLA